MPRIYETISGHEIEYPDPDAKLARFLARVQKLVDDPKAKENDIIVLVYGPENPILDRSIFPERGGGVTRAVFDNPVYHVLMDMQARKRFAETRTKVEDVAARYTLSVADAAKQLGIHKSAIHQAIQARRVPSWKKGNGYFLDPRALGSLERAPLRGPKGPEHAAPLEYRAGYDPKSKTFVRIRHVRGDVDSGKPVEGKIDRWRRVAVLSGAGGNVRFFELEPAEEPGELTVRGLFVRGPFKIARKLNNRAEAEAAWEAFEAA